MAISTPKNLIVIDPNVQNYQSLLTNTRENTQVVLLEHNRNGIEQISEILATQTNIESIQIISHGSAGMVQLGNIILDQTTLQAYSPQIEQWGNSLTANADILFYGCNVGEGELGVAFLNHLSNLTGADIAASNDLTGNELLGGDWDLEVEIGNIEAELALAPEIRHSYNGVLKIIQVTNTNDSGSGSLREAIIEAGNSDGIDVIDLRTISTGLKYGDTYYIDLQSSLPTLNTGNDIFFIGNNKVIISGLDKYQIIAIDGATVGFQGLTFLDGYAKGGDANNGGGGGLGAGGAVFVNKGTVTFDNVTFNSNSAQGGSSSGTGGTGFRGDGNDGSGSSGGSGGALNSNAAFSIAGGGGGAGRGGNADNGGNGQFGAGGGAGGGGGDANDGGRGGSGGRGGFGAGGGAGGGGGYDDDIWPDSDDWGQGGSGGSGGTFAGSGTGGNDGQSRTGGRGGGGAGLGGALFIREEGNVTIFNGNFSNNSVSGGTGVNNGQALGVAIASQYNNNSLNHFGDGTFNLSFQGSDRSNPSNTYDSIPTIKITPVGASEKDGKAEFRLDVINGSLPMGGIDVFYYVSETVNAVEGSDFSNGGGTKITLTASGQVFHVPIINDNDYEEQAESLTIQLLQGDQYKLDISTTTLNIEDNDTRIAIKEVKNAVEGDANSPQRQDSEFELVFDRPAVQDFSLYFEAPQFYSRTGTTPDVSQGAVRGSIADPHPDADYKLYWRYKNETTKNYFLKDGQDTNEIALKAGDGQGDRSIIIGLEMVNNEVFEKTENVTLKLKASPSGDHYVLGDQTEASINIKDDEPIISISKVVNPQEGFGYGSTLVGLGKALELNQGNEIIINNNSSLDVGKNNSFTQELWLSVKDFGDKSQPVFSFSDGGPSILINPDGTVTASFTSNGEKQELNSNQGIKLETWTHLATTFDGEKFKLFINGQETLVKTLTDGQITFNLTGNLTIGSKENEQFKALIDEVKLWNIARSQGDIQINLIETLQPETEPNLVGYWQFEGNLNDSTANNNHGINSQINEHNYPENPAPQIGYIELQVTNSDGQPFPVQLGQGLWVRYDLINNVNNTDITTGGIASASAQNLPNEGVREVFDNNNNTKWLIFSNQGWVQYQLNEAKIVREYKLTSGNDEPTRDPKKWTLQGSNNGVDWTNLDSRDNETFSSRSLTKTFTINNNNSYQYYRLNISNNNGATITQLAELQLFAIDPVASQFKDYYNSQFQISSTNENTRFNGVVIPQNESTARIYFGAISDAIAEGNEPINVKIIPYNVDNDRTNPDGTKTKDADRSKYGLKDSNGNFVKELNQTINIIDNSAFQAGIVLFDQNGRLINENNPLAIENEGKAKLQIRLTSEPIEQNLSFTLANPNQGNIDGKNTFSVGDSGFVNKQAIGGLNNIDVGNYSGPTVVDIDGDGDNDLFIGTGNGKILYWVNIGTKTNPIFVEQTDSNNPLNSFNNRFSGDLGPHFSDLDKDGDLDAIIGRSDGNISYYQNTGTKTNPIFTEKTGGENPFNSINVGSYAQPVLIDINNNGTLDLFVGAGDGKIYYYENTGTDTAPNFPIRTGTSNPLNGITIDWETAPSFINFDGDNDFDLVLGSREGNLRYYQNTGDENNPNFVEQTLSNNPFNAFSIASYSTPSVGDINGDNLIDVLVGLNNGQLVYLEYLDSKSWESLNTINLSGITLPTGQNNGNISLNLSFNTTDPNYQKLNQTLTIPIGRPREDLLELAENEEAEKQLPIIPEVSIIADKPISENSVLRGTFFINLSDPAPRGGLTIPFKINAGTAILNQDYQIIISEQVILSGTEYQLIIPEGKTTGEISISLLDDLLLENTENIELELIADSTSQQYIFNNVNPENKATLSILDDDQAGILVNNVSFIDRFQNFESIINGFNDIKVNGPVSLGNIDQDNDLDLFYVDQTGQIKTYRNNNGTYELDNNNQFSNLQLPVNSRLILLRSDLYVIKPDGKIDFYDNFLNNPSVLPQTIAEITANNPSLVDFDSDGDLDAFGVLNDGKIVFYENKDTSILKNKPSLQLSDRSVFADITAYLDQPLQFADVDQDADLDLFQVQQDGTIKYYQNTGANLSEPKYNLDQNNNPLKDITINGKMQLIDVDNDGDADILIQKEDGSLQIQKNSTEPQPLFSNSAVKLITNEDGKIAQFGVKLTAQPAGNVTLKIGNIDLTESQFDKTEITFTPENWNQEQIITVTGLDDNIQDLDINYNITIQGVNSNEKSYQTVSLLVPITNRDNEENTIVNLPEIDNSLPRINIKTADLGNIIIPEKPASALKFDGINDYVEIPSVNISSDFTIETWAYIENNNKEYSAFIELGVGYERIFFGLRNNQNNLHLYTSNNSEYNTFSLTSEEMPKEQWVHLAITVDSNGEGSFYVNGIKKATQTGIILPSELIKTANQLGKSPYGYEFKGSLQEVRIWDTVRSETEIKENYLKQLEGNETGLKVYYRADESAGNLVLDRSSNQLNGSLQNGTLWQTGNVAAISNFNYPVTEFNSTTVIKESINLTVSQAFNDGQIGLKISQIDGERNIQSLIKAGSLITFNNGAIAKVSEDVIINNVANTTVKVTRENQTNININEAGIIAPAGRFEFNLDRPLSLPIEVINGLENDSLTLRWQRVLNDKPQTISLPQGSILQFANGTKVEVIEGTTLSNETNGQTVKIKLLEGQNIPTGTEGQVLPVLQINFAVGNGSAVVGSDYVTINNVFPAEDLPPQTMNTFDYSSYYRHGFVDIDGDNDVDLFVGNTDGSIDFYENQGSTTEPQFVFVQDYRTIPFYKPQFVWGNNQSSNNLSNSAPAFADMDGDNDMDAVAGYQDTIRFYANINGSFEQLALNLDLPLTGQVVPSFADLDGDGDQDLIIGVGSSLFYLQNDSTPSNLSFTPQLTENPLKNITGLKNPIPSFVDLDNDGDRDLIIKNSNSQQVRYFMNIGDGINPIFAEQGGENNPLNWLTRPDLVPGFADFNGDGKVDLALNMTKIFDFNNLSQIKANLKIINNQSQGIAIIKPGETKTYIDIQLLDDQIDDDDRDLEIKILAGNGYRLGTNPVFDLNDSLKIPPTLSVEKTVAIPNTAKVENGVIKLSDNSEQIGRVFINNISTLSDEYSFSSAFQINVKELTENSTNSSQLFFLLKLENQEYKIPLNHNFTNGLWTVWVDYNGVIDRLDLRYSLDNQRPENANSTQTITKEEISRSSNKEVQIGFDVQTKETVISYELVNFNFLDTHNPTIENYSFNNFTNTEGLTLTNNATVVDDNGIQLVKGQNQKGEVFFTERVSLDNDASFSTFFQVQVSGMPLLGEPVPNGALAFVFGQGLRLFFNEDTQNNNPNAKQFTSDNNNGIWNVWIDYNGETDIVELRYSQDSQRPSSPTQKFGGITRESIVSSNDDNNLATFALQATTTEAESAEVGYKILQWNVRDSYAPFGGENVSLPETFTLNNFDNNLVTFPSETGETRVISTEVNNSLLKEENTLYLTNNKDQIGLGYTENSLNLSQDGSFTTYFQLSVNGVNNGVNNDSILTLLLKSETQEFTLPINGQFINGEWGVWVDYDGSTDKLELRYSNDLQRPVNANSTQTVTKQDLFGTNENTVVQLGLKAETRQTPVNYSVKEWQILDIFEPLAFGKNELKTSDKLVIGDNDQAGVIIFNSQGQVVNQITNLAENGNPENYTVKLSSQPTNLVEITLRSNNEREGLLKTDGDDSRFVTIKFTPDNWNNPQSFTVIPQNDNIDDGKVNFAVISSVSSQDINYSQIAVSPLLFSNEDDDNSGVILRNNDLGSRLNTQEGITDGYTVKLKSQPNEITKEVRIIMTPANDQFQLNDQGAGQAVTISFDGKNWNQERTIRAAAMDDDLVENTHLSSISFAVERDLVYQDFENIEGLIFKDNSTTFSRFEDTAIRLIEKAGQTGGVFSQEKVVSLKNNHQFSSFFRFQINDPNQLAAGLVFLISKDLPASLGTGESGLGYQNLANNLAIEFDVKNNEGLDKNSGNHIAINVNGSVQATNNFANLPTQQTDVYNVTKDTRLNNGGVWNVWVDYDGQSDRLQVRIADNLARPLNPTLTYTGLRQELGNIDSAYLGFTAANNKTTTPDNDTATIDLISWEIKGNDPIYSQNNTVEFTNNGQIVQTKSLETPTIFEVEIKDNDLPSVSLIAGPKALEGTNPSYFTVQLDNVAADFAGSTGLKINYQVVGGSAINNQDFQNIPLQDYLRIAPGQIQNNLLVFPIDDFLTEAVDFQITNYDPATKELTLKIADTIKLFDGTVLTFNNNGEGTVARVKLSTTGNNILTDAESGLKYIEITASSSVNIPLEIIKGNAIETGAKSGVKAAPLIVNSFNADNSSVNLTIDSFDLVANSTLSLPQGITATVTESKTINTTGQTVKINLDKSNQNPVILPDSTATINGESLTIKLLPGDGYNLNNAESQATLEIVDNEISGVRIATVGDRTVVREGEQTIYSISLLSEPQSPVTINIFNDEQIKITNLSEQKFDASLAEVNRSIDTNDDGELDGKGTLKVRLFQKPEGLVSLQIPQQNEQTVVKDGVTTIEKTHTTIELTFSPANWNIYQTVENVPLKANNNVYTALVNTLNPTNGQPEVATPLHFEIQGDVVNPISLRNWSLAAKLENLSDNQGNLKLRLFAPPLENVTVKIGENTISFNGENWDQWQTIEGVNVSNQNNGFIISDVQLIKGDNTENLNLRLETQVDNSIFVDIPDGQKSFNQITFNSDNWSILQDVIIEGIDEGIREETVHDSIIKYSITTGDPNYLPLTINDQSVGVVDRLLDTKEVAESITEGLGILEIGFNGLELPLIGSLGEAGLTEKLGIEDLKKGISNTLASISIPTATEIEKAIEGFISQFELFGKKPFDDVDVRVTMNENEVKLAFELAEKFDIFELNLASDFGWPAFGLKTEGKIEGSIDLNLGLAFGIHKDFGPYIDVEETGATLGLTVGLSSDFGIDANLTIINGKISNYSEQPTEFRVEASLKLNDIDKTEGIVFFDVNGDSQLQNEPFNLEFKDGENTVIKSVQEPFLLTNKKGEIQGDFNSFFTPENNQTVPAEYSNIDANNNQKFDEPSQRKQEGIYRIFTPEGTTIKISYFDANRNGKLDLPTGINPDTTPWTSLTEDQKNQSEIYTKHSNWLDANTGELKPSKGDEAPNKRAAYWVGAKLNKDGKIERYYFDADNNGQYNTNEDISQSLKNQLDKNNNNLLDPDINQQGEGSFVKGAGIAIIDVNADGKIDSADLVDFGGESKYIVTNSDFEPLQIKDGALRRFLDIKDKPAVLTKGDKDASKNFFYLDINKDKSFGDNEPKFSLSETGFYFLDLNGNGELNSAPESYLDKNNNNKFDDGETFFDYNFNGQYDETISEVIINEGKAIYTFYDANKDGKQQKLIDYNRNGIQDGNDRLTEGTIREQTNPNGSTFVYLDANNDGYFTVEHKVLSQNNRQYLDINDNDRRDSADSEIKFVEASALKGEYSIKYEKETYSVIRDSGKLYLDLNNNGTKESDDIEFTFVNQKQIKVTANGTIEDVEITIKGAYIDLNDNAQKEELEELIFSNGRFYQDIYDNGKLDSGEPVIIFKETKIIDGYLDENGDSKKDEEKTIIETTAGYVLDENGNGVGENSEPLIIFIEGIIREQSPSNLLDLLLTKDSVKYIDINNNGTFESLKGANNYYPADIQIFTDVYGKDNFTKDGQTIYLADNEVNFFDLDTNAQYVQDEDLQIGKFDSFFLDNGNGIKDDNESYVESSKIFTFFDRNNNRAQNDNEFLVLKDAEDRYYLDENNNKSKDEAEKYLLFQGGNYYIDENNNGLIDTNNDPNGTLIYFEDKNSNSKRDQDEPLAILEEQFYYDKNGDGKNTNEPIIVNVVTYLDTDADNSDKSSPGLIDITKSFQENEGELNFNNFFSNLTLFSQDVGEARVLITDKGIRYLDLTGNGEKDPGEPQSDDPANSLTINEDYVLTRQIIKDADNNRYLDINKNAQVEDLFDVNLDEVLGGGKSLAQILGLSDKTEPNQLQTELTFVDLDGDGTLTVSDNVTAATQIAWIEPLVWIQDGVRFADIVMDRELKQDDDEDLNSDGVTGLLEKNIELEPVSKANNQFGAFTPKQTYVKGVGFVRYFDLNDNGKYDENEDYKFTSLPDTVESKDDGDRLTLVELVNYNRNEDDLVSWEVSGTGQVGLNIDGKLGNSDKWPGVETILLMNIPIFNYQDEGKASNESFSLEFKDISVNLGGFITGVTQDLFEKVQPLLDTLRPVINILTKDLEFPTKFGLADKLEQDGKKGTTIIEIAQSLIKFLESLREEPKAGAAPTTLDKLIKTVKTTITVVDTFVKIANAIDATNEYIKASNGQPLKINMGSYKVPLNLASSDSEATPNRNQPKVQSTGDEDETYGLESLFDEGDNTNNNNNNPPSNPGLVEKAQNFFSALNSINGLEFPIITNPQTWMNILLGQTADLVTYDIPDLNFDIDLAALAGIPVTSFSQKFGPLSVNGALEGNVNITTDLAVGLDTFGFLKMKDEIDKDGFDAKDLLYFLDTFYLLDAKDPKDDPDLITITAKLGLQAAIDATLAKLEAAAGIIAQLGLDLVDFGESDGTSDGKIRLVSDIIDGIGGQSESFGGFIKNIIEVSGSVELYLKLLVEVFGGKLVDIDWKDTLFEFSFGGGNGFSSSGRLAQSYIAGALVFFDSNFNNIVDPNEPYTLTLEDGSFNLEISYDLFDLNSNGIIDPNEGRLVGIGGTDTSSGLTLANSMTATPTSQMITPITTLVETLVRDGVDEQTATTQIKQGLGLPDEINLTTFDPILALKDDTQDLGKKVYQAHVQVESLLSQANQFIEGATGQTGDQVQQAALGAIANALAQNQVDLTDPVSLQNNVFQGVAEAAKELEPALDLESLTPQIEIISQLSAQNNQQVQEAIENADNGDVLTSVAPIKVIGQGTLPSKVNALTSGETTLVLTAEIPAQTATEGEEFNLNLTIFFSDLNSEEPLEFNGNGFPDGFNLSNEGLITGKPNVLSGGEYIINITARDQQGEEITTAFNLTVTVFNENPQLVTEIENKEAIAGDNFTLDISNNFTDPDIGDILTFSAQNLPAGITISEDGIISGITEEIKTYPITITVTDQGGLTLETDFNLTFINGNNPPTFTNIGIISQNQGQLLQLNLNDYFTDPDGDILTFTHTGLPENFTLVNGVISGIPTNSNVGIYNVQITATDPENLSITNSFTLEILKVNQRPVLLNTLENKTIQENETLSINISNNFSDPDLDDVIRFTANNLPAGFTITDNGLITGLATNNNVGIYDVTISAIDNGNETLSTNFTLTITDLNSAPQIIKFIPKQVLTSGDTFSLDISKNFADEDIINGDSLRFTASGLPEGLTITENGLISGLTTDDIKGQYEIVVTAIDNLNTSRNLEFALEIKLSIIDSEEKLTFGNQLDDDLTSSNEKMIFSGAGNDTINGTLNDSTNQGRFYGGQDNDKLIAGTNDVLFGGPGDDILDARQGGGDNQLFGGQGNDQLYLGIENDIFAGGSGQDTFIFSEIPTNGTINLILDFDSENDLIDLSELADATISIKAGNKGAELNANDRVLAVFKDISEEILGEHLLINNPL